MLHTIPLANKPLCIVEHNNEIFIGDARGRVLKLKSPFFVPETIAEVAGPVSTIFFGNNQMFYGTWDGILYSKDKEIKLGSNSIKCGCFYNGILFISIDSRLILLTEDFIKLEKIETESKIFGMDVSQNRVNFAMSNGSVSTYTDKFEKGVSLDHEMSILCLKNGLTGSTDNSIRNNGKLIFEGKGWIRSIWSSDLFSSGPDVYNFNNCIYSHKDEVVGIVEVNNTILSIGLDYCYKIYQKEISLTEAEELELLAM